MATVVTNIFFVFFDLFEKNRDYEKSNVIDCVVYIL